MEQSSWQHERNVEWCAKHIEHHDWLFFCKLKYIFHVACHTLRLRFILKATFKASLITISIRWKDRGCIWCWYRGKSRGVLKTRCAQVDLGLTITFSAILGLNFATFSIFVYFRKLEPFYGLIITPFVNVPFQVWGWQNDSLRTFRGSI